MWTLIEMTDKFAGSPMHQTVINALSKDVARNYFLLLGMRNPVKTYEKLWFENMSGSVLALRRSGNAQLSLQKIQTALVDEIAQQIVDLRYQELITTKLMAASFKDLKILGSGKPRSYIASLSAQDFRPSPNLEAVTPSGSIRLLNEGDLPMLLELNALAFDHSAPEAMLRERIKGIYGRGFGIFSAEGMLIAALQTECETPRDVNLVGVATHPANRRQGLASALTSYVAALLLEEGKNPHLMFDNRDAGRIYETIGFKVFDQTIHFSR